MSSNVASKIRQLVQRRQDLGITQRSLDKMVGVSSCMIAKWEAGHRSPTAESLDRWANALGLRVDLVPVKRKKAA